LALFLCSVREVIQKLVGIAVRGVPVRTKFTFGKEPSVLGVQGSDSCLEELARLRLRVLILRLIRFIRQRCTRTTHDNSLTVVVRTSRELSQTLLEAPPVRMMLRLEPQMPLATHAGEISAISQQFRQCDNPLIEIAFVARLAFMSR